MGTTYMIAKQGDTEFYLDEHSNKLDVSISRLDTKGDLFIEELKAQTPEVVIQMALKMLKVCSYWTEEGAVEKAIIEFKAKGYHW